MTSYEIVVIGTGPAGHHAAIEAAKLGRSVAIIERPGRGSILLHRSRRTAQGRSAVGHERVV